MATLLVTLYTPPITDYHCKNFSNTSNINKHSIFLQGCLSHLNTQRPLIPSCIYIVLLEGVGKIMIAGEIFLGTHIKIPVLLVVKDGVDHCNSGYIDRTERQPGVFIRVVG